MTQDFFYQILRKFEEKTTLFTKFEKKMRKIPYGFFWFWLKRGKLLRRSMRSREAKGKK